MKRLFALAVGLALLLPDVASAQLVNEVRYSLRTLSNPFDTSSTQFLLTYETPAPGHIVLLFAGGNGLVDIHDDGAIPATGLGLNFLIRSRGLFVKNGVAVVVVNAPNKVPLNSESMRLTSDYVADMGTLITNVRSVYPDQNVRLWLVGTSSGTISAVSVASKYTPPVRVPPPLPLQGIVLTATQVALHQPGRVSNVKCTGTIYDASLTQIRVPTYVVTSKGEACPCAKPAGSTVLSVVNNILNSINHAPVKGHTEIDDAGSQAGADVCTALTAHGFYNAEARAVKAITDWIKTH